MKILFISGGQSPDYQCDMLFHGLRQILGADVIDSQRLWFMYESDVHGGRKRDLYGKGFSLYGLLPDIPIDREDIEAKLRNRYFDIVVYGSVWRYLKFFPAVELLYPRSRIALIDGEDHQMIRSDVVEKGVYFKRECLRTSRRCIPINFALPKCRVREVVAAKTKLLGSVIPGRLDTYIYDDEHLYYEDYSRSIFGVTKKKDGWDCLRHYEILANGCIPLFIGVQYCPSHTLSTLPKRFLRRAQDWYLRKVFPISPWIFEACRAFAADRLTTEVLARDFLDALKAGKRTMRPCPLWLRPLS